MFIRGGCWESFCFVWLKMVNNVGISFLYKYVVLNYYLVKCWIVIYNSILRLFSYNYEG